jgi:type VI protein secretion system component Hcp
MTRAMLLICGVVLLIVVPVHADLQPKYVNSVTVQNDADLAGLGEIPVLAWEWASGRAILSEAPNLAVSQMTREHILLASGSQRKFTPPAKNLLPGKAPGGVLRLTRPVGKASQALMSRCTTNRTIPSMKLALCGLGAGGSGKTTLLRLELKNVSVTSYRLWGPKAGPRKELVGVPVSKPVEEISLAYGEMRIFLE